MYEFKKDKPIYLQVSEDIIDKIVTGKLLPGTKLSSIRELAKEYSVNPNTIQRTTAYLLDEELINVQRGIGNIIAKQSAINTYKKKLIKTELSAFLQRMSDLEVSKEHIIDYLGGWDDEN